MDGHQSAEALKKLQTVDKAKQLLCQHWVMTSDMMVWLTGQRQQAKKIIVGCARLIYESNVKSVNLTFLLQSKGIAFKLSMRNKQLIEEYVLEGLLVRKIRYIVTNTHLFSLRQRMHLHMGKWTLLIDIYNRIIHKNL